MGTVGVYGKPRDHPSPKRKRRVSSVEGLHVTEAFAVGRFVGTERHGWLALAARMGTNFAGRGFHIESELARFRTVIQDFLAKCAVNPDEFILEK